MAPTATTTTRSSARPAKAFATAPIRALLTARADARDLTVTDLADILRLPRRTLHRILTAQQLRWDTADRVAIALGHHPSEIWPTWHAAATAISSQEQP